MELTKNWETLGSATLYGGISILLTGRYTSQSITDNNSVVEFALVSSGTYWRTSNGTASFTGAFTDSVGCATYPNYIYDGDTIARITKTISHDDNGDLSFNIGGVVSAIINNGTRTANVTQLRVDLPHINRYATITKANDFTDEGNPSFTFANSAGYRINARLEFGGNSIRRDNISNTGSYTFELTTSERNTLRQACTGKTMSISYVLATCYTGSTEAHTETKNKTMSIVNADPTFSVAYQDSNSTTTAITQNNQQIIQNNSTLQFNITSATSYKYASLSSVAITINGITQTQSISSSTLTFNYGVINVANDTNASVVLTDSRGFTKTISVALTVLSWNTPNAIITLNRKSNYYTETDINVDANYSSLDSKNTIDIKYRIKKKTASTWGSYSSLSDNVTSTFNADNLYEWDVQVVVTDRLGSTTYNLSLGIGIPIQFIDRRNRNVGIDCFPDSNYALDINGNQRITGNLYLGYINANEGIIVDSGNGYIKYGNGIMICYGRVSRTVNLNTQWSPTGLWYGVTMAGETFAKEFTGIPFVQMSVESSSTCWLTPAGTSLATKTYNYQLLSGAEQSNLSVYINYVAIGTWK